MATVVHTDARKLFQDFAMYPRWVMRSHKLSADETAWYLWFLSHAEGYEITKDGVKDAFPNTSERTYQRVMQGLNAKGLVKRSQQSKGRDSFGRVEYVIHVPSPEEVAAW